MSRIVLRLVVFCVCDPVGAEHTFKIHGALLYACYRQDMQCVHWQSRIAHFGLQPTRVERM